MRVLLCTVEAGQGPAFVRELVDARLVACGNIIANVQSIYRWQGAIHDDPEDLLVMETAAPDIDACIAEIQRRHPYDVPKILALEPAEALPAYLAWAKANTTLADD